MLPLIHIVDDDAQVRAATSYLLSSHGFATETYSGGSDFLARGRLDRGCLLLDLRMPDMDGHQVQEELVRRGAPIPVVVMSGHGELAAAVAAMRLGAVDFLPKPPSEEELLSAVRRALALFSEGQEKRNAEQEAAARLERLSPRERQMLQGLVAGLSNKEIARRLGLSPRTVEMHRANMMDELGTETLSEALRIAIDARLPPLGEEDRERASAAAPAAPQVAVEAAVRSRLRRYEEKVRLVLDASTDGAWEWRVPQDELVLSRHLLESLGYSEEEAPRSYRELAGLIHPADWERFSDELAEHLKGGGGDTLKTEFRIRNPRGGWIWLCDCGSVVDRDSVTGAPIRMVGTVSDITRKKAEEQRVRDAAERIELAQWGAGAGVWEIDLATQTVRMCPRSRTMLGLPPESPEEMTRERLRSLVHPEDLPAVISAVTEAEKGGVCRMEFRSIGPHGGRWILGLGKVAPGRDGRPERLFGLYQDVTENKEAALELQRLQRQLIDMTQLSATGTMASTLAHELAQPLMAISNFSRGIAQRLAETPLMEDGRLRDALAGAEASARLAADIVGRLRRSAGHAEAERQPVRLGALVRSACSLALSDADAYGIRHSIALDAAADRIEVDPVQIQQLLLNLVRNAAEAVMEVPVPQRRIRVTTRRIGPEEVEIEVADSGAGIPPELGDTLFELFSSSKGEGRGIGLSICRAIASAHGGGIRADTAPGGGALFSVTLRA